MADKKDVASDPRALWLLRRVCCVFAVRRDKIDKFLQQFWADEQSCRALNTFLQEVEVPVIFFHHTSSGETCTAAVGDLPNLAQMKKKVLACVRTLPEAEIELEPGKRPRVVLVEFSKNMMDVINSYCHSVYLSVLMNPANQKGWSDLISRDLIDKFHSYLASLHVTAGLMRGQTLLPLPPREAVLDSTPGGGGVVASKQGPGPGSSATATSTSKDRVHVLEGAVVTWTKQVRYVLKQEPEHVFKDGKHPEPCAELQFWRSRASNLNSIHAQLQMEGVKRVLRFLEANKSTYVAPFSRKEVEDAREEANDNVRFLKTLEGHINTLLSETADFDELDRIFDIVFHVLLLIWRYSKYYNTLSRISVLIRQICNSLIAQATRFISGSSVFEMIAAGEARLPKTPPYNKQTTLQITTNQKQNNH
ncbi:unnamed protein product [Polarella glacialis]|nr:unnamed protein product [Polarella glacialis]